MNQFKLQWRGIHITYKEHHNLNELWTTIKGKLDPTKIIHYSLVNERGHGQSTATANAEDTTGYEHCHVAIWMSVRQCTRDCHKFDLHGGGNAIHPNLSKVRDIRHFAEIYHNYHKKDPVDILQSEIAPPLPSSRPADAEGTYQIAKRARSIAEAAAQLGIEIKTISDIALIRNDRTRIEPERHRYAANTFTLEIPDTHKCVYIYGPSGTGKTEWALHRFEQPLLVRSVDQLRGLDADVYDGFVWDEFSGAKMAPEELILCFETERPTTIRARYSDAIIPAGFPRVFTSNLSFHENVLCRVAESQIAAIQRRVKIVQVTGPTYVTRQEQEAEGIESLEWNNLIHFD